MLLDDEIRIKKFYITFCKAVGKDPSSSGVNSAVFFGVFALQTLQSLRTQAISAYEFAHDFEQIYSICYFDERFKKCMEALNPDMGPLMGVTSAPFALDTEARNICWKLARLLALKFAYNHKSEGKNHRRNLILLSAASIVFAANIGKSIMNNKVSTADDANFVELATTSVSTLMNILAKNSVQSEGVKPIRDGDIDSYVLEICISIAQLRIPYRDDKKVIPFGSNLLLSKVFTPAKHYAIVHDYRHILEYLVAATQKELKIATANTIPTADEANTKTGIVNVLLFFPMVIGEPWGLHRDAPILTSKMLFSGEGSKSSILVNDVGGVVTKVKPAPKVIKRKATTSESRSQDLFSIRNKKAKVNASSEPAKKNSEKFVAAAHQPRRRGFSNAGTNISDQFKSSRKPYICSEQLGRSQRMDSVSVVYIGC